MRWGGGVLFFWHLVCIYCKCGGTDRTPEDVHFTNNITLLLFQKTFGLTMNPITNPIKRNVDCIVLFQKWNSQKSNRSSLKRSLLSVYGDLVKIFSRYKLLSNLLSVHSDLIEWMFDSVSKVCEGVVSIKITFLKLWFRIPQI